MVDYDPCHPDTLPHEPERRRELVAPYRPLVGPDAGRWAEAVIRSRGIPGMRTVQGLLSLARRHTSAKVGHMKMGYFPTPPTVTARLRRLVRFPKEPFSVLDPCAGEGVALAELVKGSGAVTYGIELDRRRASRAKRRLDHTIRGDFFRCRVSPKSASLMLLNPPYAHDDDGRLELLLLKAALPGLGPGGVLLYLIPQRRLTSRVARILAGHLDRIRVYRFPDPEYDRFRQIVVLGVKRAVPAAMNGDELPDCLEDVPWRELKALPARAKAAYDVPPSPPIRVFKSNEIDQKALAKELAASKLGREEVWIAGAAGLSSAFGGCFVAIETGGVGIVPGWIIGVVVGAVVFNLAMGLLTKDRYYRP